MDLPQLLQFYRARGYDCFETPAGHWMLMDDSRAVNLPPLDDIYPTREDIRQVFKRGAWAVRFCTTGPWEPLSQEFVLKASPYDLSVCKQKARNQVRASMSRCAFQSPSEAELIEKGLEINLQTAARHRSKNDFLVEPEKWRRYMAAILAMADVHPYAAYVNDALVAYLLLVVVGERFVIIHPFMNAAASKQYPMNGLLFHAINDARQKRGPLPVSYGFGSMWNIESLDRFKMAMGFEPIPRARITLFARSISPMINSPVGGLLKRLPLLQRSLGERYARMLEEKQLGSRWWDTAPESR
ncbi:MAG TPA: GNAT family N-acetyltransferase [Phycisphaerae bacterium]|nr:GNAT family N-acetyltransferase [Phycisphaerae bacterium]HRY70330.1 GNAT family N-acetyltransferase [Phycisphaerae bacterium]HSA28047.1 GNAT family N-acetyltransferase [Phycisphaerae bacterium]